VSTKNTFASKRAQHALDAIRAVIKSGDAFATAEIGNAIGRGRSAIGPYLRYMAERGEIHCLPASGNALLWKKGPAPLCAAGELDYDEVEETVDPAPLKRKVEAARQIGMWRDSLVAALFGDAGQQVAL
jgi:hypothetical protein